MKGARDFTVGETFEHVRTVDAYRPVYYAAASGDFNPIHVDPDVGRAAGYQGVILQGMCTYHGEQELELLEVVRPGDVLTTVGEIIRIQERGNLDFPEVTTTTTGAHGRVVVRGVWTAIIRS